MLRTITLIAFLITATLAFGQNTIFKYLDTTHNKLNDVDPNKVKAIRACPDGKFMAIGSFQTYNSRISPYIIRLNRNGSIDTTFHSPFDYNNQTTYFGLLDIEISANGSVFVLGQTGRPDNLQLYKLKSNGDIDPSFHLPFVPYGLSGIEIKNEQIILIGNSAYSTFSPPYLTYYVMKLNMDGTINQKFKQNKVAGDPDYKCLALQDSSLLLYGNITSYNNVPINRIIRISPTGDLDNTFNANPNNQVRKIIALNNNEFIIIGSFTTYNGSPAKDGIVRVNNTGQRIGNFDFSEFPGTYVYDGISIGKDSVLLTGRFDKPSSTDSYRMLKTSVSGAISKRYFASKTTDQGGFQAIEFDTITKQLMAVGWLTVVPDGDTVKKAIAQYFNIDLEGKIYSYLRAENGISTLSQMIRHLELKDSSLILIGGTKGFYKGSKYNSFCKVDKNLNMVIDTFMQNSLRYTNLMEYDYAGNYYVPYSTVSGNYSTTGLGFFVKKYFPDYTPDLNFNQNLNQVSITNGFMNSYFLQKDGKIVLLMYLNDGTNTFFLDRYNTDGSKDLSFHRLQWNAAYASNPKIIKAEDQNCYYVTANNLMVIDGITCPKFFKISNEGYVDQSYRLRMSQYTVGAVFPQGEDLYLAGSFMLPNTSTLIKTLVKINRSGYVDPSFNLAIQPTNVSFIPFSNGRFIVAFAAPSPTDMGSFILVNSDGSTNTAFGTHYIYGGYGLAISDNQFGVTAVQLDGYNALGKLMVVNLPDSKKSYKTIEGTVYKNPTCNNSTGDLQEGIIVKAIPGNYYAITDNNGKYKLNVDTLHNDFTVVLMEDTKLQYQIKNTCDTFKTVHFNSQQYQLSNINFSTNSVGCNNLTISVSSTNRRRCFKGKTTISVCNNTSFSQKNVELHTVFPKYIQQKSYSILYNSKTDSLTTFIIPEIFPYQTFKIEVIDSVVCGIEEIRGLQQCVEAYTATSQKCVSGQPTWDGSYVKLIILPSTKDVFKFRLQNIGANTMADSAEYRIFYNDTLAVKKNFLLSANAYGDFEIYTESKTIRVEANQSPGYPLKNTTQIFNNTYAVTTGYNPSYRVSTAIDNERDDYSITCGEIRDSFDPNDKNVLPKGQGITNIITGKEKLTYTIRFQNTGTDTAYTIRIVDTLSSFLNVSTFHVGTSSHPFQLKVSGTDKSILTFLFDGINLPDSSKNLLKSQGYINYTIYPEENISNGTKILNVANIYFDYNNPIKTNTVEQTIGNISPYYKPSGLVVVDKFITTGSSNPTQISNDITLYPNPITTGKLSVKSETSIIGELAISDITGRTILFKEINNYQDTIDLNILSTGIYIYRIYNTSGEIIYSGKLIKEQ